MAPLEYFAIGLAAAGILAMVAHAHNHRPRSARQAVRLQTPRPQPRRPRR
ncbi:MULTISPECIES: hypothetical protein [Halomonadaceae]|nr:hypothetical protein [Halomonas sp. 328]MBF8221844.1 hypothetical protein [Halomonas sp. 328]